LYSGETAQAANPEKRPEQIGLYMAAGIQSQHKSFVGNQGGAIMQTLGKIAATLGVIGAIAASCPPQRGTAIIIIVTTTIIATTAIIIATTIIATMPTMLATIENATTTIRWGRLLTLETEL
jgi:hypothetical protein